MKSKKIISLFLVISILCNGIFLKTPINDMIFCDVLLELIEIENQESNEIESEEIKYIELFYKKNFKIKQQYLLEDFKIKYSVFLNQTVPPPEHIC